MLKVIRPGRYEFLFGNRSVIIPIGNHRFETDKPLLISVPTKLGDLIEVDETTTVTVKQLALSPAARKIAGKGGDEPENYGIVAIHLEAR